MSFLFPSAKPPQMPPPPPPLPTRDDSAVEGKRRELAEGLARKRRAGMGVFSAGGGLGDTSEPLIKRQTLLG